MGNFLIGAMVGGTVGVFTMAMCISAKRADEHIEKSEMTYDNKKHL